MRRRIAVLVVGLLLATLTRAGDAGAASLGEHAAQPTTEGISAVVGGDAHACARSDSGVVSCWGENARGEGGNVTGGMSTVPVPVASLAGIAQVAAGSHHSCALGNVGTLWCWGRNDQGQLGVGTTSDSASPLQVALDRVVKVVAGRDHTCALAVEVDGRAGVWCWGSNASSQLGATRHSASLVPAKVDFEHCPRGNGKEGTCPPPVDIGAGGQHTCAILSSGSMWCWGSNEAGQVGGEKRGNVRSPRQVDIVDATGLTLGDAHTCVVRFVRQEEKVFSEIWCWGANGNGELGNGSRLSSSRPTRVLGLKAAKSVDAGSHHTCAIEGDDRVWCWGINDDGQLGSGLATGTAARAQSSSDVPVQVVNADGSPLENVMWTGHAGARHTCVRGFDANVYCWGSNARGQLGDGTVVSRPFAGLAAKVA